jgi:hypothetical protein
VAWHWHCQEENHPAPIPEPDTLPLSLFMPPPRAAFLPCIANHIPLLLCSIVAEKRSCGMAGAALPEWGTVPGARGDAAEQLAAVWRQVRAPVVVPLLRLSVALCLVMLVLLFAEKVYLSVVILVVRLLGRRPERRYRWEPMRDDDDVESGGGAAYPMVLVQIPMYNEREVS